MQPDHGNFMRIAIGHAEASLAAGEFPVGCVMVADGEIVAAGRRSSSRGETANELDHAEITALRSLINGNRGIAPAAVTVYSTMEPCLMCYATLLLNGIRTFVYAYEDVMGGGTALALEQLPPLYQDMRPAVIPHVLRAESLRLFQAFFSRPGNTYWQESLLARYTLEQQLREAPPCQKP